MENKNTTDKTFNTVVEPHNHRAIIGFDKNGIPKVLVPVSGHTHKHVDKVLQAFIQLCTTALPGSTSSVILPLHIETILIHFAIGFILDGFLRIAEKLIRTKFGFGA